MNEFNTTPVKSPINPNALIGSDVSTPQHGGRDEEGEEMLVGSFSAMKVTQGGNLSKRCADSFTIEGSPVNVNNRFKRQDIHPTPLKASFYGGQDFDDTPLLRVPVVNTSTLPVNPSSVADIKKEAPANTKTKTEPERLLVICSASEEHNTGDHQENALRTALLCGAEGCLRRPEVNPHIRWIDSDNLTAAPLTDLLRVHEYTYLRYLEEKCRAASTTATSTAPNQQFPSFYAPPGMLDSDTPLQPQSLDAAKRFCGAAILAVDHVMKGYNRDNCTDTNSSSSSNESEGEGDGCSRAFVIGRPPGHHAGPHGCVPSAYFWQRPDMASSGFCLLNTVAVAAAYARHQYGRWAWRNTCLKNNPIVGADNNNSGSTNTSSGGNSSTSTIKGEWRAPRIAIVDIDIHHGNGTEEIVRNLSPRTVHLPLPSSWAPVTTLSYKPWLNEQDEEEVFFSSVHLYAGDRFYPCSGPDSFPADTPTTSNPTISTHTTSTSTSIHPTPHTSVHTPPTYNTTSNASAPASERLVNIALTPIGPGPWDRKARAKLTVAQREALCRQASAEFRAKVSSMLLPRLAAFRPDLLFISAGFDAHHDDYYHFLTESDLHWVTDQLCQVADNSSGGSGGSGSGGSGSGSGSGGRRCGVISVLEGGYSLSSPILKSSSSSGAAKAARAPVAGGSGVAPAVLVPTVASDPVTTTTTTTSSATVTSPVTAAATAEAALGRGGRLKAKKEKGAATSASVSAPAPVSAVAGVGTGAVPTIVPVHSPEYAKPLPTTASHTSHTTTTAHPHANKVPAALQEETMFAQRPGDGGLVKGVLAHAAALAGHRAWLQLQQR